ncbi:DUF6190 family protein [Nocardia sp. NPDC051570]|uniref:DUF6190 family protein n=1 Tax=Nocardia sp. NPDC051570 TaxID=3364324 RepID=UPI0037AAD512
MCADIVVDAWAFLGMHSRDEALRHCCKGFFAQRLGERLIMSLEEVGRCDDVVWGFPRDTQDAYYPFMDNLHTDARIDRLGYDEDDVRTSLYTPELVGLPMRERLLLGMVLRREAVLYTANPRLRDRADLPVRSVPEPSASGFPDRLELLYQDSLALRV